MERGKHVVTANKALLATHWEELVTRAEERRVNFGFEGSVGGGIPIIHTIRRGLVGNRIRRVTGIINGTCNYILTRMARERKPFAEILADAQANGFAEANPALDVDGIDAAQKLTILVNLCFGMAIGPDAITRCGIREVTPLDLATAEELGYRIKLLGSTVAEGGPGRGLGPPGAGAPLAPARLGGGGLQRALPGGRQPRPVALLRPRRRRAAHRQRHRRRPGLGRARHPLRRGLAHAAQRPRLRGQEPGQLRPPASHAASSTCGSGARSARASSPP